jgi:predicted class III extradiol MEMO1 family dioxygenase
MNNIKIVEKEPLSDDIIKKYLPNSKIIKYSEFKNYRDLNQLLPNNKDYIIILYEASFNTGHWCSISKFNDNYEYFDSYGNAPSVPLSWNEEQNNINLGQDKPYLNMLLDNSTLDSYYNDIAYQIKKSDINTCGRHNIFRILCMKKRNMNLKQYHEFMKKLKSKSKENYDKIVSYMINII